MNQVIEFANICQKDSIAVTYDLAIAKIALQLQAVETPKYYKVFVHFGIFHI